MADLVHMTAIIDADGVRRLFASIFAAIDGLQVDGDMKSEISKRVLVAEAENLLQKIARRKSS